MGVAQLPPPGPAPCSPRGASTIPAPGPSPSIHLALELSVGRKQRKGGVFKLHSLEPLRKPGWGQDMGSLNA